MIASATSRLSMGLSHAILNQDDVQTVKEGAPAYLLLIDGLIEEDPENVDLLLSGARLYGAYAAAFVASPDRRKKLTVRSREYARRAACEQNMAFCLQIDRPYGDFLSALALLDKKDASVLYTWSVAELGWIQAHRDDWNAIAALPKVEAALGRVIKLEETYEAGAPHLYLGILKTLRPPTLGGKPLEGKAHFERAIELSRGRNLTAKVEYARYYARLVFDRELHDRLLHEVLESEGTAPGLTLMNVLAKEEARKLLATSNDYF